MIIIPLHACRLLLFLQSNAIKWTSVCTRLDAFVSYSTSMLFYNIYSFTIFASLGKCIKSCIHTRGLYSPSCISCFSLLVGLDFMSRCRGVWGSPLRSITGIQDGICRGVLSRPPFWILRVVEAFRLVAKWSVSDCGKINGWWDDIVLRIPSSSIVTFSIDDKSTQLGLNSANNSSEHK